MLTISTISVCNVQSKVTLMLRSFKVTEKSPWLSHRRLSLFYGTQEQLFRENDFSPPVLVCNTFVTEIGFTFSILQQLSYYYVLTFQLEFGQGVIAFERTRQRCSSLPQDLQRPIGGGRVATWRGPIGQSWALHRII